MARNRLKPLTTKELAILRELEHRQDISDVEFAKLLGIQYREATCFLAILSFARYVSYTDVGLARLYRVTAAGRRRLVAGDQLVLA